MILLLESISLSRKIELAGEMKIDLRTELKLSKLAYIGLFVIASSILLGIFSRRIFGSLILFVIGITSFSNEYRAYKYGRMNGIYTNGIIFFQYLPWRKIHSFKNIDNNEVSILTMNGERFEIKLSGRAKFIIDELNMNNIKEER